MEGPHFTCCDAMRCKCVIAARSCIRGVPSGVKPVFAQGACLSLSLSMGFLLLDFSRTRQPTYLFSFAYAAIHPASFVAAVEGGGGAYTRLSRCTLILSAAGSLLVGSIDL